MSRIIVRLETFQTTLVLSLSSLVFVLRRVVGCCRSSLHSELLPIVNSVRLSLCFSCVAKMQF